MREDQEKIEFENEQIVDSKKLKISDVPKDYSQISDSVIELR